MIKSLKNENPGSLFKLEFSSIIIYNALIMGAELFHPKLSADKPSLYRRVTSAIRSRLGISKYEEVYGEIMYPNEEGGGAIPYPAKAVLKDGHVTAIATTFRFWTPREFVDQLYTPSFANGRCIDLSNGDYKTVLADQDGKSDKVIKRYHHHTYWGVRARENAEAAASKLNRIYAVMMEICPQHILPTERFTHPMPYLLNRESGWAVFERQKRAIFCSPWLHEELIIADKLEKEKKSLSHKYHYTIARELRKRGICRVEPLSSSIGYSDVNFNLRYDCLTRTLVADDIINCVYVE